MSKQSSQPPKIALFILRQLYPKRNREALAGDLSEQFFQNHSSAWVWRQVLVAILIAAFSQLLRVAGDITAIISALGVIYVVPWTRLFPLESMGTPNMDWPVRLGWLLALESLTGVLVVTIFGALLMARRAFRWSYLVRVYAVVFLLLSGADLLILRWALEHPVLRTSEAGSLVQVQWLCIAAVLLISAVFVRRLSVSDSHGTRQPTA